MRRRREGSCVQDGVGDETLQLGDETLAFSHHQKSVFVDVVSEGGRRRVACFIGGLDLTNGRYDTPERRCSAEIAKSGSNLRKLGERAVRWCMPGSMPGPRTRTTRSYPAHALGRYSPSAALAFRPRRAVSGVAYRAGGCKTVAQCELALLGHQGQQDPALQQVQRRPRDALRMGSRTAVNIMLPLLCFFFLLG